MINIILFVCGTILSEIFIIWGLKGPIKEKSYLNICDNCNKSYHIYELIPIISYFINKGKCKFCNNKLSKLYLLLEILGGISFVLSYNYYGISYEMIILNLIVLLCIVTTVSDLKYYIILDSPLIIIGCLILINKFIFYGFKVLLLSLISGLFIFLFMLIIKILGDKFFKTESLGGGDIKLSTIFGFVLGLRLSIITIVVASFLALPFAVYATVLKKQDEIPFGPFLVFGLLITFVFMDTLNNIMGLIF